MIENDLRSHRVAAKLTQAQLAERVGVSRVTINAIEAGRWNPSLELALKLASSLDAPLGDLFYLRVDDQGRGDGRRPPRSQARG